MNIILNVIMIIIQNVILNIFRFIGSSRGWLMAAWKWLRPRFQPGIIHYLPHDPDTDPDDIQLPDLSEPVPDNWVTVQVRKGSI